MSNEQEMLKKAAAAERDRPNPLFAMGAGQQQTRGLDDNPCRIFLRERIHGQRHRAQQEARRAEALQELEYLFEKHPEVARILDLLDQVKE